MDEVDRIGRELAAESYGVVTATELRRAGVDLTVLPRLVAAGRWQRLWRGVYVTAFYVNPSVHVRGRFVGILDVYLVGTGVGGEMGSKERHEEGEALDDTLVRHEHANAHGLSLVHVTPTRYRADPDAYHRRLLAAVADREQRGLGEPEGLVVTPRGPLLQ